MKYLLAGATLQGMTDVASSLVADGEDVLLFDRESDVDIDVESSATVLPMTWSKEFLTGVDRVVTSPWFSDRCPPLSDAIDAGVNIVTEAGFGLERLSVPYAAVTGTNGKTTVTQAATAMLVASGIRALAAGNIGTPVSALTDQDADVLILELSSYQLRFIDGLAPEAAAILNIAPDHLDWHGTFERYVAAKARVFATMEADALLAYNADDPVVAATIIDAKCRLVPCSGIRIPENGNGVDGRDIVFGDERVSTRFSDRTLLFDLVVAATLATAMGGDARGVATVVDSFTAGPHRRQLVRVLDGVTWINDSKATNPHATVAAVGAYPSVVLLTGGRNKNVDLSPIAELSSTNRLIAFGESGPEIASLAAASVDVVPTLEAAVAKAREIAAQGDTVLLSPGCASFDEFSSYAERGEVFIALVGSFEGIDV
ncbi:MAG: UDP-N-acetylmuramoyl-L-alanine--D-glutamate ligase [Acidimicrobiia bacterium]